jgi:hypothetical protein
MVCGAAVLALYGWQYSRWGVVVDDAFISFRYAENLARHGELVFNLGESVEGYSNFSWTLLLAGLASLGAAPEVSAPALGFCLGLLTLLAVYWCARRVLECGRLPAFVGTVWLALSVSWTFWSASGMESVLFSLLVVALWAGLWSRFVERRHGPAALGAVAALLALTRPEGLVFVLALPAALLARRRCRRHVLWGTFVSIGLVGAHLAWRHAYYEAWLPNSYAAKVTLGSAAAWRGLGYVWGFLREEAILLVLPVLVYAQRRSARILTLSGIILAYTAFIVLVGGDGLYRYRFFAHLGPALALTVASGLDRLARGKRRWMLAGLVGISVSLVLPQLWPPFFRQHSVREVRSWEERWEQVGKALQRRTPTELSIATNVAGRVPYYSQRPTLDMLGLADPVVARHAVSTAGRGYAGHERAAPEYVLSRQPRLIYVSVLDGLPRRAFRNPYLLRSVLAAGSLHGYAKLVESTRFRTDYRPAFLQLADGSWCNVFLHTAAASELAAAHRLQVEAWRG